MRLGRIVDSCLEVLLEWAFKEMRDPDGWEADLRTRKIRRKRADPVAAPREVFEVCGRCGKLQNRHRGGRCP